MIRLKIAASSSRPRESEKRINFPFGHSSGGHGGDGGGGVTIRFPILVRRGGELVTNSRSHTEGAVRVFVSRWPWPGRPFCLLMLRCVDCFLFFEGRQLPGQRAHTGWHSETVHSDNREERHLVDICESIIGNLQDF